MVENFLVIVIYFIIVFASIITYINYKFEKISKELMQIREMLNSIKIKTDKL